MTTPDQPTTETVLKFRSASGRTEIAQRPDGTVSINVLHGSDILTATELAKAAWALGVNHPAVRAAEIDALTRGAYADGVGDGRRLERNRLAEERTGG